MSDPFNLKDPLASHIAERFSRFSAGITKQFNSLRERMSDDDQLYADNPPLDLIEYYKKQFAKLINAGLKIQALEGDRDTTGGSRAGYENYRKTLKRIAEQLGYTPSKLVQRMRDRQQKERRDASGMASPFSWDQFNTVNRQLTANAVPPNLEDAFRELLISKAQENEKQYDEGTLDQSRIAEYWKGDIFTLPIAEKKSKVKIYVYRDNSGSMGSELEDTVPGNIKSVDSPTKDNVVNDVLTALFSILYEAHDLGLPIKFGLGYWTHDLLMLKDPDDDITLEELNKKMEQNPSGGGTRISPVVQHYTQIIPDMNEKIIVIVLSDGDLSGDNDFDEKGNFAGATTGYQVIENHPTDWIHLWLPIGFKPYGTESKKVFGEYATKTRPDVYNAIISSLQKVLDQIYR